MKYVHWPLMGGLLHVVQQGGEWAGPQPKCNSPVPTYQRQRTNHPYCCIMVRCSAVLRCPWKG